MLTTVKAALAFAASLALALPAFAGATEDLLKAAKEGAVSEAKTALEAGANPNARDEDASTPLHGAALGSSPEVVRLLLEVRANPNARDKDGQTPLHRAALGNGPEVVKLLLEADANPDARDDMIGSTPLYWAAKSSFLEAVKLLLEAGADPNARNKLGLTPLQSSGSQEQSGSCEVAS